MEKYWDMLFDAQYEELRALVKKELEEDEDNYELWYILFLADNNNYIDFDSNNVNNEIAFNKAKSLASVKAEMSIMIDYQLYSNLKGLNGFSKAVRLYSYGKYERCFYCLEEIIDDNVVDVNADKICDSLESVFASVDSVVCLNLQILIINALYLKTKSDLFKKLFEAKTRNQLYKSSVLELYSICNTGVELKRYVNYSLVFGDKEKLKDEEIAALKKDLSRKEQELSKAKTQETKIERPKVVVEPLKPVNPTPKVTPAAARVEDNREPVSNLYWIGLLTTFCISPIIGIIIFAMGASRETKSKSVYVGGIILACIHLIIVIIFLLLIIA